MTRRRAPGLVLLALGLMPIGLPLMATAISHALPGCAANELGATGCSFAGHDLNEALAAPFRLLPWIAPGFALALAGALWTLSAWSAQRAQTRRAKHR
ncbi:MAG: hypothetical protein CSA72_11975 [Rhodobacterales bacterium]|nr:MAG: hypothetical protein CSA72_11975 [Rhodobacterales bacterium]